MLLFPWLLLFCADADFLITQERKGMLAALTAVSLSSCRRVCTCCRLFMCVAPKGLMQRHCSCAHAPCLSKLPYHIGPPDVFLRWLSWSWRAQHGSGSGHDLNLHTVFSREFIPFRDAGSDNIPLFPAGAIY